MLNCRLAQLKIQKFQSVSRRLKFYFWVLLTINQTVLNYQSIKFSPTLSILSLKKANLLFFCFFCSALSSKIGRQPGSASEDPKLKTCSLYGIKLFQSQILKHFGRFWRFVITLNLPMEIAQKRTFFHIVWALEDGRQKTTPPAGSKT